jgi:hypothetical protein
MSARPREGAEEDNLITGLAIKFNVQPNSCATAVGIILDPTYHLTVEKNFVAV